MLHFCNLNHVHYLAVQPLKYSTPGIIHKEAITKSKDVNTSYNPLKTVRKAAGTFKPNMYNVQHPNFDEHTHSDINAVQELEKHYLK